jgi:mannosyl-oligosaccharide glucosidase
MTACRTARPLLLGMMWFDPTDIATVHKEAIRHEAQQGDKLSSYGWVRHDGRSYGRQEIADGDFQLSVQMVSITAAESAAADGNL